MKPSAPWLVVLVIAISCGGKPPPPDQRPRQGLVHSDDDPSANLARDLEATLLVSYSQLSLGNYDAYLDGVAQDVDLAIIGLSAGDTVTGPNPGGSWIERKPYYKRAGARVFSKNLRVALSADKQVGWVSDEVSYRVPFLIRLGDETEVQRVASIPMRVTAAFVRNVDRWVMVMEHTSYGLPAGDIVGLARAREIRQPPRLPAEGDIAERTADEIASVVEAFHRPGDDRSQAIAADDRVVLMLPDSSAEYRGEEVAAAPTVEDVLGGSRVEVLQTRVSARIGRTAWMVANLRVMVGDESDRVSIPARGSYILEAQREEGLWRWRIVQAHVSVPLDKSQLDDRVFGGGQATETAATE